MSTTKTHEERRKEILDAAEIFFITKGYQKTTIIDILKKIGIAKGTFYHYFTSKEEVLDAIVMRFVSQGVTEANKVLEDNSLMAHEKLLKIIMAQKPTTQNKELMINQLHDINNAEMHQKSISETVKHLTPILIEVIQQGIKEGVFNTPYPQEVIEVLLVSSTFLFDDHLSHSEQEEMMQKVKGFIYIMEVTLGAEKGSLDYMSKVFY